MTFDTEDEYLNLFAMVAARSEYAVAERGVRNDLDTVEWTVAVISGAISGLAGGMLAAWGEDLAEATRRLVRRITTRQQVDTSSAQQVQDLESLHRIVVEVRGKRLLPEASKQEIINSFKEAGLDDEAAQAACVRLMRIVEGGPEDDGPG